MARMNDLELIDAYCEKCIQFITPELINEVAKRGLYDIVNYLPRTNFEERKAIARARLANRKLLYGDEEINQIASDIRAMQNIKDDIALTPVTEPQALIILLNELKEYSEKLLNFYK